ncbi:ABC transporter permease [Capsulimonas corticalis]|uniref:ABC transporter permease n=1 Tax=Capsulimonas corticalis TaxID=2219043 RepID=A0A402CRS2_9BACT|nr:urea ABC transporter permease subunit UrtC [Capsulimonas corticalis]BDI28199.1 ABC transporter permease [Capsulimonas corticalis]
MAALAILRQPKVRFWITFLLIGAVLLIAAPLGLPVFRLNLLGKFLAYAIVALGLDLIWGYGGMLSLGQGLFFGIGAYCMAMYLKLEASGKSLPDFMDWSGVTKLPWFWQPFHSAPFAIVMAVVIPMAMAAGIGYLIFRSRVQGVYFSIITQALTMIVSILLVGQQQVTGGTNGITGLTTIFGHDLAGDDTQRGLYYVSVLALGVTYLLCRWLVTSRLGRLLVAMRDDENRVRFLGYNPIALKTLIFAISAGLAGLAGALFVPQVGIISPSAMAVAPSIEMVIWVAVGGRGTLVGAVLGALLVNTARTSFSESYPDIWQYFQGALFIGTVLLFPYGLVGFAKQLGEKWRARRGGNLRFASAPAESAEREAVGS